MSWRDANSFCKSKCGHLASVPDQETNDFLTTLSSIYSWIGGRRTAPPASIFEWTDGSPWVYSNWASDGQPNDIGGTDENRTHLFNPIRFNVKYIDCCSTSPYLSEPKAF